MDTDLTNLGLSTMVSSEMLRRVALVRTDVSEELSGSVIRVTGSFPCLLTLDGHGFYELGAKQNGVF
jgi:hypothetical protein